MAFVHKDGDNFVLYRGMQLAIGPWWVFLATVLLLPVLAFGAIFWLAGWVIRWRYQPQEVPRDARAFLYIGRVCGWVFLGPRRLYFRLKSPHTFREWSVADAKLGRIAGRWAGLLPKGKPDRMAPRRD